MSDTEGAAPTAAPAGAEPVATFVSTKPRWRTVPLEWPIEYAGKVYNEITVHRMTTAQIGDFISAAEKGAKVMLPMFGDTPAAVIDALDPDDSEAVNEAVRSFLPRGMRAETEPQAPGANTSPSPQLDSAASPSPGS
jgi:hypothetical protein